VADLDLPNAFATGRSPERAVVCVTTGILGKLTAEELEAVLAHELSHVAHRDVLVMTLASSAGIVAGMLTRGAAWGGFGLFNRRDSNSAPAILVAVVISLVVYAISFFLLRLLSRYRELSADRAGAYLTMRPQALATALQKITGEMAAIPQRDLRASQAMNSFFFAPAVSGATLKTLTATHPSLEQRLEQLARIQAELSRPEQ
jgi:heat shock protein HtpX